MQDRSFNYYIVLYLSMIIRNITADFFPVLCSNYCKMVRLAENDDITVRCQLPLRIANCK